MATAKASTPFKMKKNHWTLTDCSCNGNNLTGQKQFYGVIKHNGGSAKMVREAEG
jgi:hypothetical protein